MRRWTQVFQTHWCDAQAAQQLPDWFRSPLGQRLQQEEQQRLETILSDLFGYYLLWLDSPWPVQQPEGCRIRHQLALDGGRRQDGSLLRCQADALPIQADCIDTIVLPHVLEFADNPHQILREVDRCLIPEGYVVVLGFSPWGLWGLRRWLAGWNRKAPWCGRFLSAGRLRDWFSLLGFDTVQVLPISINPPLNHAGLLRRMEWLNRRATRGWPMPPASYVYVARKRVMGMTPIRPRWRPRRAILSPGVAEPSQRTGQTFSKHE